MIVGIKYNPETGEVKLPSGAIYYESTGLNESNFIQLEPRKPANIDIRDITALKEAGFNSKDIIEMKAAGVL